VLSKLQRHIYKFRNTRSFKYQLATQIRAAGLKHQVLLLDMLVRWNSTYEMIRKAYELKGPITAVCSTQEIDPSLRPLMLTPKD